MGGAPSGPVPARGRRGKRAARLEPFLFGERAAAVLPERVRHSIDVQQGQAEILIGWAQLALVVFFWALYSLTPKTSDLTPFRPVPWILSAYLAVTLVRLALAYRRIIAPWFLLGSVVADIGLLMLLIWSYHVQYMQPPSFSLKAPTAMYVFLFVALRTLRFEATYVLAAGLAAAVGWGCLLAYALFAVPGSRAAITHDYVAYLTSNRILVGAEVDKIICILLVTAVLAVALVRARRLLLRAVSEESVRRDLSRFVTPEVAQQIARADRPIQAGDAEVKTASVLFCDIEGFSALAERLPPERVMQALNEYFAAVADVIDRHGGVISGYQGDAMLITFNTVRADSGHAANALRTALGIQAVLAERRFGEDRIALKTRCGINTGTLVAGAVGAPDRLLFTVYGDEVNIAARLEQLNKSFGTYVLASEQTLQAAGGGFAAQAMGEVNVRGRSRPINVFAIDAEAGAVEAGAVEAGAGVVPFAGLCEPVPAPPSVAAPTGVAPPGVAPTGVASMRADRS